MRRLHKIFCGLLCLVLGLSMCLGGTLAWQSLDQTARNDVKYTPPPADTPTPPVPPGPEDPDDDDDTVRITVKKIWEHGSAPKESWPDSVEVYVYADGELVSQRLVTEEDGWKHSFLLPKYAKGRKIVYTVGEKEVPGYSVRIDGYDIINTYIEPTGPTPTPGTTPGPGETSTPGVTPGPDETSKPGVTPGPGETFAPGVTPTPGTLPGPVDTADPGVTPGPGESTMPGPVDTADPGVTPGPEQPPAPTEPVPDVVKTGDTGELNIWIAVTVSGAIGLAVCLGYLFWEKRRYAGKRLMKK